MMTDYQSPLSSRYAVDILSLVYENEKIMATDMLRIAKNYKTVIKTADELVDLGLMTMHLEAGRRLTRRRARIAHPSPERPRIRHGCGGSLGAH